MKRIAALLTFLFSSFCYGQSCPTGYIQTGQAALVTPVCTSVVTSFDVVNRSIATGNVGTGTLVASTVAGMYGIRVYASAATANALATISVTMSWTENGIARTLTTSVLSLANINNTLSQAMPLYVDAATAITYSATVAGTTGSFSLHIDGRPPSV